MANPIMIVKGKTGEVWLYQDHVSIHRKGCMGFLVFAGSKGVKDIRLKAINSVQLKKPGMMAGYIQFAFSGGKESKAGVLSAADDENSVLIGNSYQYRQFEKLREKIYELQEEADTPPKAQPASSPLIADELTKLVNLRDQGVLSDQEFERLKKKLLDGS